MKQLLLWLFLLAGLAQAQAQDDPDPERFFGKIQSLEELFVVMEKARPDSARLYSFFIDSMAAVYLQQIKENFDRHISDLRAASPEPVYFKSVAVHYRAAWDRMNDRRFYYEQQRGISIFRDRDSYVYELSFSDGIRLASYSAYWIYVQGRWVFMRWI